MSSFGRRLTDAFVPDLAGRRAVEETVADWRDERRQALSAIQSLSADVALLAALLRVLTALTGRQLVSGDLWRPFGFTVLAAASTVSAYLFWACWSESELARSGGWPTAFALPGGVALLLAPIAAIGLGLKRDGPRPVLGLLTLTFAFLLLVVGWVAPAANQAYRQAVWTTFQSRGELPPPSPGVAELLLPDLVRAATGPAMTKMQARRRLNQMGMIALLGPTLLLFGETVRQRMSRGRSWRLVQAVGAGAGVASLVVATAAWPIVRQAMMADPAVQDGTPVADYWVPLAIVWGIIIALVVQWPAVSATPAETGETTPG